MAAHDPVGRALSAAESSQRAGSSCQRTGPHAGGWARLGGMRREWEPEELIACWTLLDSDRARLGNKAGATLLWLDADCWAIDTTGPHLLDEKVRGKLLTLQTPKLALAVRGTVDLGSGSGSRKGKDGWSLVLPREHLQPIVEQNDDLDALLCHLVAAAATTT